ncbi:helix-turn-helix domain-containing protein [Sphingobacterium sp. DK4209]|uniref:Helix-turn-helix domain-containing protein n=1 Tax=Sphingobacterium zhuxiongii TaxID=2662364 RepID=A0A5Q0Q796_9SPHI|nr:MULTISPECIES: AraC family transcriptional regulator [unclassified Sphingobacterium]MVZ66255.1 helix-turn-helix domain-containing protein [Sphingobacterium sp. DK4209]QGA24979.1 helix-turn-helix domain-containing protein [Sphingobacterium sp. dk4302]
MLKAKPEILQSGLQESFLIRAFGHEAFFAPYHYHPEYELTYIVHGKGKRYVGNRLDDFSDGDFVLIGPNQPHCWKLDQPDIKASAVVIQFTHDFLGADFFDKPEFANINALLKESQAGLSFLHPKMMTKYILRLRKSEGVERVLHFLDLLNELCRQKYETIDIGALENNADSQNDSNRINVVMAYIVENFKNDISLDDVANVANLTPNAFCKYFKKLTRKTFVEMLVQYRMNFAVQQLLHTDDTISAIALASGFNDMSYFYKTFRGKMGMSPLAYRKQFME